MTQWYRMYNSVVHDPKVQRLPATLFKAWVNMLCIASENGGCLPPIETIAYTLHLTEKRAARLILSLERENLLESRNGHIVPHNWHGRQFQSDGSTPRVKAFRERHKKQEDSSPGNVSCNVSETAELPFQKRPETVTVTPPDRKKDAVAVNGASESPPAGSPSPTDDADYFRRGKEVLGEDAGGLLAKLKKQNKGNVALSRAALEMASTKQNPREYFARVVHGKPTNGKVGADGFDYSVVHSMP